MIPGRCVERFWEAQSLLKKKNYMSSVKIFIHLGKLFSPTSWVVLRNIGQIMAPTYLVKISWRSKTSSPLASRCVNWISYLDLQEARWPAMMSFVPRWGTKDSGAIAIHLEWETSMFENWLCGLGSFHLSFQDLVFSIEKKRIRPKCGFTDNHY